MMASGFWPDFKRLLGAAALAGLLAGLALTAVQQWRVAPLIAQAEVFEEAAAASGVAVPSLHDNSVRQAESAEPAHEPDAWQPEDGWQRTAFTTLANVTLAVGFGLLLGGAMRAAGSGFGWQRGMAWGAAGYLVLFVIPALGLPPELPGTAAAPLQQRQLWWLFAVCCGAGGLACLTLTRSWLLRLVGLLLLAAPIVISAPLPDHALSSAPLALAHQFVRASAFANALLWLVLGAGVGYWNRAAAPP